MHLTLTQSILHAWPIKQINFNGNNQGCRHKNIKHCSKLETNCTQWVVRGYEHKYLAILSVMMVLESRITLCFSIRQQRKSIFGKHENL